MGRQVQEFEYGEYRFTVRQAGGSDGMDAFFLLGKGALGAFVEVVRDARALTQVLSKDFRRQAQDFLYEMAPDTEAEAKAPGAQRRGGLGDMDVSALVPVLQGLQKLMASLPQEERAETRRLLLFNGGISVVHPDMRPNGTGKVTGTLTKELWDDLFEGDPLGAWYCFGRVIWANLGKSSPALAAFRKRAGTGKASPSAT